MNEKRERKRKENGNGKDMIGERMIM